MQTFPTWHPLPLPRAADTGGSQRVGWGQRPYNPPVVAIKPSCAPSSWEQPMNTAHVPLPGWLWGPFVAPGITFPEGMSLCSPSVPAAARGISLSPWGWRGGDVGTEEMLCQDATCSRDPRTDSTEPIAVGGGGQGGDEPGITAGSSWHYPLQPLDQHHPSGTQHAVPSQPWLLWHSDTYQLCGMQVPPWQLHTATPTAKIPPGTSCCLTCCCCICAAVAGCAI